MVLTVIALLYFVLAAHAAVTVYINDKKLDQLYNDSLSMANATYEFRENEMAYVKCDGSPPGIMTFKVKDEPDFDSYVNATSIYMYMRMTAETDGKYIECHQNKFGVESIVRVVLKRKPTDTSESDKQRDSWDNFCCPSESQCPRSPKYNTKAINGLGGLDFSRIRYRYCHPMGHQELHYEYKDQQYLDITWAVDLRALGSNEYTVYWKDKLVLSLPIIEVKNDCRVILKFKPIIPAAGDDCSIIKFGKSITYENRAEHEQTRIILRRISVNGTEQDHENGGMKLSFYIPIGLACFLVLLLITVIFIIVKSKLKVSGNATGDNNYGNLENEGSINQFPSQWENYANVMERRDPDLNSMGRLYATPLPKSHRKGQQSDTYVNVAASATPSVDEGLYSVVERCRPSDMAAPCTEQNYHNIVPTSRPST